MCGEIVHDAVDQVLPVKTEARHDVDERVAEGEHDEVAQYETDGVGHLWAEPRRLWNEFGDLYGATKVRGVAEVYHVVLVPTFELEQHR